jgi:hypothetical protein
VKTYAALTGIPLPAPAVSTFMTIALPSKKGRSGLRSGPQNASGDNANQLG